MLAQTINVSISTTVLNNHKPKQRYQGISNLFKSTLVSHFPRVCFHTFSCSVGFIFIQFYIIAMADNTGTGTVHQGITWMQSYGHNIPSNDAALQGRRIHVYGASSNWTNLQWYPALIENEARDPQNAWNDSFELNFDSENIPDTDLCLAKYWRLPIRPPEIQIKKCNCTIVSPLSSILVIRWYRWYLGVASRRRFTARPVCASQCLGRDRGV